MDYSEIAKGDIVVLRDKREIEVTDISDQHPDAYRTYDEFTYERTGEWKITSEVPKETILIGTTPSGRTVVTDMSEVVRIK